MTSNSDNSIARNKELSPETSPECPAPEVSPIHLYFKQLTEGCSNNQCTNDVCASNPSFVPLSANEAAIKSVQLFKNKAVLCIKAASPDGDVLEQEDITSEEPVSSVYFDELEKHVISSEEIRNIIKTFEPTKATISSISEKLHKLFGHPAALARSFRVNNASVDSNTLVQNMEIGGQVLETQENTDEPMEVGSEGGHSSNDGNPESSISKAEQLVKNCSITGDPNTCGTRPKRKSKKVFKGIHNPLADILVDVPTTREFFAFMNENEDLAKTLISCFTNLCDDMLFESNISKDSTRSYFNVDSSYSSIFVILLENYLLSSPEYISSSFPTLLRIISQLPLCAQAQLAKFWSCQDPEELVQKIGHINQFITVQTLMSQFGQHYAVSDHVDLCNAVTVLNIFYHSSLIGGTFYSDDEMEIGDLKTDLKDYLRVRLGHDVENGDFEYNMSQTTNELSTYLGINPVHTKTPLIASSFFINETLNDVMRMEIEFLNYLDLKEESQAAPHKFSFLNYPFCLTTYNKQIGLMYDNKVKMYHERSRARAISLRYLLDILASDGEAELPSPYLKLQVNRESLVHDALQQMELYAMENPNEFKKQLFVEFQGEQGVDEGGVSKEFFQLIIEQIFVPDFGMFVYDEATRNFWFNSTSFEEDEDYSHFTLVGMLLGLAIYNNIILDVHFPMVVYKKLLGLKGVLSDLEQENATLYNSLQHLLNYEGDDVEEVYGLSFSLTSSDMFGCVVSHDLKPNGANIPVTSHNRKEYVDLYVEHFLNRSISEKFRAFRVGFNLVVYNSMIYSLFRPDEIELLVCGDKKVDFHAMEKSTIYDGGYSAETDVVRWFWQILHEMTDQQKKLFLTFSTGSDRVPLGGLSRLKLIIAKNGDDSYRLPTAHTCFNVLLLPEYSSKEKLRDRLLTAITHAKGFGMQ